MAEFEGIGIDLNVSLSPPNLRTPTHYFPKEEIPDKPAFPMFAGLFKDEMDDIMYGAPPSFDFEDSPPPSDRMKASPSNRINSRKHNTNPQYEDMEIADKLKFHVPECSKELRIMKLMQALKKECFLCGDPSFIDAKGKDPWLLECAECKRHYHEFCIPAKDRPEKGEQKSWRCFECDANAMRPTLPHYVESTKLSCKACGKPGRAEGQCEGRLVGPYKDQAFDEASGNYIHEWCAFASEEVVKRGDIWFGLAHAIKESRLKHCYFCKEKGASAKCGWQEGCRSKFHVGCALERNFFKRGRNGDPILHCDKHGATDPKKEKQTPPKKPAPASAKGNKEKAKQPVVEEEEVTPPRKSKGKKGPTPKKQDTKSKRVGEEEEEVEEEKAPPPKKQKVATSPPHGSSSSANKNTTSNNTSNNSTNNNANNTTTCMSITELRDELGRLGCSDLVAHGKLVENIKLVYKRLQNCLELLEVSEVRKVYEEIGKTFPIVKSN